jgi:hypothetical protein
VSEQPITVGWRVLSVVNLKTEKRATPTAERKVLEHYYDTSGGLLDGYRIVWPDGATQTDWMGFWK